MRQVRQEALVKTPESTAEIRRIVQLGRAAVQLNLHEVPGVIYAKITDYGETGVQMPEGHVHVEVWGGDLFDVWRTISGRAPPGVQMTLRVHPVTWVDRLIARTRWILWRLFRDPRGR